MARQCFNRHLAGQRDSECELAKGNDDAAHWGAIAVLIIVIDGNLSRDDEIIGKRNRGNYL